jgi:hypothetical protein
VPNPLFKPPSQLVKEWPEVFEDLYITTMPVAYLDYIRLDFADGRVWKIDIKEQLSLSDPDLVADKLLETIEEYQDEIKKIDFKINIDKLKKDIGNSTKDLL